MLMPQEEKNIISSTKIKLQLEKTLQWPSPQEDEQD